MKAGIAAQPDGANWRQIYGASLLCGIGFTMSLFIGALAFPGNAALIDQAKLGILAGSLLSAIFGYLVLRLAPVAEVRAGDAGDADEVGELFGADQSR